MRFLRFHHMKPKHAFVTLKHYYQSKQQERDVFTNMLPSELDHVFSKNLMGVLPDRDNSGRLIMVVRMGAWNPSQLPFIDVMKGLLLCFEQIMVCETAQIKGVSMLCDCDGWGYSNITGIPSARLKSIVGIFVSISLSCSGFLQPLLFITMFYPAYYAGFMAIHRHS